MKYKFRDIRLSTKNKVRLNTIEDIVYDYQEQGYRMTLRQLYYQLVSRDIIPNKVSEYGKLSRLLKEGRMGGIIDWDAIEDRLRVPYLPYYASNPKDAINDIVNSYRLDRQQGQDTQVEVWVEKDALSGVLKPITSEYHINLLVNRGYASATAIHDLFTRIVTSNKKIKLYYLGDFDPSGLDIVRDINQRVNEMLDGGGYDGSIFELERIGITQQQIQEYNPPPNPAKLSDTRAKEFVRKFGKYSWEVDALPPETLHILLRSKIETSINLDMYNAVLEQEHIDREKLKAIQV